MTNQEAIEHIKNIKIYSYQDGYTDEAREALDMAIKALEAQELSNNSPKLDSEFGDLISRQAAIDALRYAQHRFTVADEAGGMGTVKWSEDVIYFAAAERVLTELPPAQPEHDENDLDFVQPHKRIPVQLVVSSDCISRQAAIDAILAVTGNSSVRELYEHVQEHGLSEMWSGGVNAAIDIIIAVPSAEPEIIRCKDCKHRIEHKHYGDLGESAYTCEGNMDGWILPDGFCSLAERRTDERPD